MILATVCVLSTLPASATTQSRPDSASLVTGSTAMVLDAAGNPVVSYVVRTPERQGRLRVLRCNDPGCTGGDNAATGPISESFDVNATALALDDDDNPVVALASGQGLSLLRCDDPRCDGVGDSHQIVAALPAGDGWFMEGVSVALDADSNPVISVMVTYFDLAPPECTGVGCIVLTSDRVQPASERQAASENVHELHVVRCNDRDCAGGDESIAVVDLFERWSATLFGVSTSLQLDGSGHPVVAFAAPPGMAILRCGDPDCAADNRVLGYRGQDDELTSDGGGGRGASLQLDASGNPVVSYVDDARTVRLLACDDPACLGGGDVEVVLDSEGGVLGTATSLSLDALDRPVVAYNAFVDALGPAEGVQGQGRSARLRIVRCNDPLCEGGDDVPVDVDARGDVGHSVTMALDPGDQPILVYVDRSVQDLKVARCTTLDCRQTAPQCQGPYGDDSLAIAITRIECDGPTDPVRAAVAVSEVTFGDEQAEWAILTTGTVFPDALAGAALTFGRAPLLIGASAGHAATSLPAATTIELARVLPHGATVYLIGGPAALAPELDESVRALGLVPVRLMGPGRIETAAAVAREVRALMAAGIQSAGASDTGSVLMATADDWPDAVLGGVLAARWGMPVLLNSGPSLHPTNAALLAELRPSTVHVIGGSAVVPEAVGDELRAYTTGGAGAITAVCGDPVCRAGGATRIETALEVSYLVRALDAALGGTGVRQAVALNLRRDDAFNYVNAAASLVGADERASIYLPAEGAEGDALVPDLVRRVCDTEGSGFGSLPVLFAKELVVVGGADVVSTRVARDFAAEITCSTTRRVLLIEPLTTQVLPVGQSVTFRVTDCVDCLNPHVAILPCTNRQLVGPREEFADADGDGFADGQGISDTGAARVEPDPSLGTPGPGGGRIPSDGSFDSFSVSITSDGPDCASVVIWNDDGDGRVAVTAAGGIVEPYATGVIVWEE